ncbi:hypothetical protein B0H17DRAFT_284754 [Mycena rosella]|uniref:Carrier domain-containing protein n=1 Tax=Mycena rosella TaxID=1033263 RepID=A0AAD7CVF0_MYCRO|nr:hypothetical protein B0H17DRAFT_284754 [Mycena rosella]
MVSGLSGINPTWSAAILDAGTAGFFTPPEIEDVHIATSFQSHLLHGTFNFFPSAAAYTLRLPPGTDIDCFHAAWERLLALNPILRTGFIPLCTDPDLLCIVFRAGQCPQPVRCAQNAQIQLVEPSPEFNPQSFSGKPPHTVTVSGSLAAGYRVEIRIHYSLLADSGLKPILISLHQLYHQRVSEMCNPRVPPPSNFAPAAEDSALDSNLSQLVQSVGKTPWRANGSILDHSRQCPSFEVVVRHCPCGTTLMQLPQFVIRLATAIVLSVHSTPKRERILVCEAPPPSSPFSSALCTQFDFDSTTALRELLDHAQNRSGPAAAQQLVETVAESGWDAIHAFLNIHTSSSWPQAHELPGWRLEDLHLAYGNPLSIDILPAQNSVTEIRISFDTFVHRMEDANVLADHLVYVLQFLLAVHQNPILATPLTVYDILKGLGDVDAPRTLEFGRRQQVPKESLTNALIHELFETCARENPFSTALEFEGHATLTYVELDLLSSALAADLHHNYGVEPDIMVPILFEPSFEMIIAILAVMKAGGAYVPLGTDLPKDALRERMGLIGGKVFICQKNLEAQMKDVMASHPSVKVLGYSRPDTSSPASVLERRPSSPLPNPTHLAYVLFTSGTTGLPNGVGVEHRNVSAFLMSSLGVEMAGKGKRKLLLSAYTFDISAGDIFSTLTSGGILALVRREKMLSNLPHWVDVTRTTHLSVTPSIARLLPTTGLPTLSHIIFGGEIVPPDLAERLNQNRTLINSMGPTEATIYATFYVVPKFFGVPTSSRPDRVPIGYPLETTILYVLRPSTTELAACSEIGEICIGGPQVARGYITNAALSKTKFIPDIFQGAGRIFRTGDWGRWNSLGQLEILGRIDGQLKFHGIRIEAEEIERVVRDAADIDLFYSAVLEVGGDQKLVGVLTTRALCASGAVNSYSFLETPQAVDTINAAISACEAHFPPNARPSVWLCLDGLPKTAHGKLDSKSLNSLIRDHIAAQTKTVVAFKDHRAPTSEETNVREVIATVLALAQESVPLDASFIELGGTSMQAMRVTTALQALGINASIVDVLDNDKTLALLAQLPRVEIELGLESPDAARAPSWDLESYAPFSLAPQQWERGVAEAGLTTRDIEDVYPCPAFAEYWLELALQNDGRALICQFHHILGKDIDPDNFAWCWEQLVIHEPTLRTVFIKLDDSKNGILSVVLKPTTPARWKGLEIVRVADADERQKLLFGTLFAAHRVELGQVPIRAWLVLNAADNTWSFATSRHHALHDARTLDLQHDALSALYAAGAPALPGLHAGRTAANSYGAYVASLVSGSRAHEGAAFWTAYLRGARPAVWPAAAAVPQAFCKDLGTYAFHVAQWAGSIGDLAKRAGVTAGALVRGAYAVATAEGEGAEEALVFEVADGSAAAGFTAPPWGFCSHVKPTRVGVPPRRAADEGARLLQIMRDANRSHVATLPHLGAAWRMAEELLGTKAVNFATSIVNILDLSRGDFRRDMKTEGPAEPSQAFVSAPSDSEAFVRPIFAGTLASESVVGIYVPVYVEVHILRDKVTYACPYDLSMVRREDMERFVGRQAEVLDAVHRALA